jgi:hypothetical protein
METRRNLAFITEAATNELIAVITEIKRMLTGLIAQMVVRRKRDRPDIASDLLAQVKRLLETTRRGDYPNPENS